MMQSSQTVVSEFLKNLNGLPSFRDGAQKLASLFKKTEESIEPDELVSALLNVSETKKAERILFSFLDIGRTDIEIAQSAFRYNRIRRLIGKIGTGREIESNERTIADNLLRELKLCRPEQLAPISAKSGLLFQMLLNNKEPGDKARSQITLLLRCEALCLRERVEYITNHSNAYSMKAMARLLPFLVICDETIKGEEDLAKAIENKDPVGKPVLTFESSMKPDIFEKWYKKICRNTSLSRFTELIQMQRERLVAVHSLIAVSTLVRHLIEQDTQAQPVEYIFKALSGCRTDSFRINMGSNLNRIKKLAESANVPCEDGSAGGLFSDITVAKLTGEDMLTLPLGHREPTVRELVDACLQNDRLLSVLLDNPRVFRTPGVVEHVVRSTKSLSILQKIASTRHLYTGEGNIKVPLALLRSPCSIPISLLRPLIHPLHISLMDLRDMLKFPFGLRREIASEIEQFVKSRR